MLAGAFARSCRQVRVPRLLVPREPRGFATNAFTVPSRDSTPEQTLFVVGLNEGKFFGQDSAEEALKLVERIAQHNSEYTLLLGVPERRLAEMEEFHKVKQQRLTPSRELEGSLHCEMIPIMQAGMVDKRPRKAVGRSVYTDQTHVAYMLWKQPREAVRVYWAFWRRKQYKDLEARKFWSKYFPVASRCYFEERAQIIAIRATEHVMALRKQNSGQSTVLVVNNDIYDLAIQQLSDYLGKDAPEKFNSQEFQRNLRDIAGDLCQDVIDLTPVLVFIYFSLPLLIFQFFFNAGQYYLQRSGAMEQMLRGDELKRE